MGRGNYYIGGFNFYYGLKRLDVTDTDWKKFYYFTAPLLRLQKGNRQSMLLRANKLINVSRFEIIKGKFYEKQINTCQSRWCKLSTDFHT